MRLAVCCLLCALLLAGCADPKGGAKTQPKRKPSETKLIVTPTDTAAGLVLRIDQEARFAVVKFPLGGLPPNGQKWSVYHQGLKVGEIRITGPQQDDKTVGDIVAGDAHPGDEVRNQ